MAQLMKILNCFPKSLGEVRGGGGGGTLKTHFIAVFVQKGCYKDQEVYERIGNVT